MTKNQYLPFPSKIIKVTKHTDLEYTFKMTFEGHVKPGQFFELSLPKFGEAPISVSGIGDGTVDFTIRKVGKVTNEVFERYEGESLFMRGPYGNGFDVDDYKEKEIVIIAGGTGLSPVKGVVDYFSDHLEEAKGTTLIAGFKSPKEILFVKDFGRWKERINVILTADSEGEGAIPCQKGLVTEYIPELKLKEPKHTAAIVVGPPIMIKFATQGLIKAGLEPENIWLSHERKMCCGIGKCGHCKIDDTYVCLDGPVFKYTKGINLVD